MRRPAASHKALPDGFADKLEQLAAHAERVASMFHPEDIDRACAAISSDLRRMARFPNR